MGKKTKVGKDRKDKFYQLAKETGFRSRAAFKLIQLNRKFGFLQESQVCIDLCAAPGGWMQVAKQNMPVSSIVIGVDLFGIRPIPGCISLIEDITTEKCKQSLTKELQSWKADVILHDGAPNVGRNWLFDAYQQICLTLNAVKLATNFLRGGGWFVTKVFRSKDYNALVWVLKQLFRRVHATKPSASRKESAEIFIVCQGYLAPTKIDPKFLDSKYVFEELDLDLAPTGSVLHPDKKRIKAEGYTEKDFSLRQELPVSEFVKQTSALSALQGVSQIIFDDSVIKNHPKTTQEIKECCKDIKVLGRKDLRLLMNWWKVLRAEMFPKVEDKVVEEVTETKKELTKEEVEEMEFEDLEKHIAELQMEEDKEDKRKRKKVQKARQRLNDKLNLNMVIKGDSGPQEEDVEVFNLRQMRGIGDIDDIQDQAPDQLAYDENDEDLDEFKPKFKRYVKDKIYLDDDGLYDDGQNDESGSDEEDEVMNDEGLGLSAGSDDDDDGGDGRKKRKKSKKVKLVKRESENPLLTDLDNRDKDTKRKQRVQLWFEKDNLKEMDNEVDEDYDLDKLVDQYKGKGVEVLGEQNKKPELLLGKKAKRRARHSEKPDAISSSDSDDSDNEIDNKAAGSGQNGLGSDKKLRLNEDELALGALMVQSRKMKRDLIDSAWNRYAFNDENLPEWFVKDEEQHMKKEQPVPVELTEEYRKKVQELNVRPIKKVMEAKARRKRRAMKRLKKAQKKADAVLDNADNSAQEKIRQIKKLYRKAAGDQKKDITYVVAKRHLAGKRARRPQGVKGRFKVVDPRMKKDKKAAIAKEKTKGRKKQRK